MRKKTAFPSKCTRNVTRPPALSTIRHQRFTSIYCTRWGRNERLCMGNGSSESLHRHRWYLSMLGWLHDTTEWWVLVLCMEERYGGVAANILSSNGQMTRGGPPTMSGQSAHRWRKGCQPYEPAALYSPQTLFFYFRYSFLLEVD
jgi:hypothetical protein